MKPISNKNELVTYVSTGFRIKYLYFWGNEDNKDGSVGKGHLTPEVGSTLRFRFWAVSAKIGERLFLPGAPVDSENKL